MSEYGAGIPEPPRPPRLLDHDLIILQQMTQLIRNDFHILDPYGRQIAHVTSGGSGTSRFLVGTRELYVSDAAGPVMHVTDPMNFGMDRYEFFLPDGRQLGHLKRRMALLKAVFEIHLYDGTMFMLERGGFSYDITFKLGGAVVGHARHRMPDLTSIMLQRDQYAMSFDPGAPTMHRMGMLAGLLALDLAGKKAQRAN